MNLKKNLLILIFISINLKSKPNLIKSNLFVIEEFTHNFIENSNPLLSSQIINNSNNDDNNENNSLFLSQINKNNIDDKILLEKILPVRKQRIDLLFNNLKQSNQLNKNQIDIFSNSLDLYEKKIDEKKIYLKPINETLVFYDNIYKKLKEIEEDAIEKERIEREKVIKILNDYKIDGKYYKKYTANDVINKVKSVDEQYEYIQKKENENKLKKIHNEINELNKPQNNYFNNLLLAGIKPLVLQYK